MKNDQTQLVLDILSSKWATRIVKVLDDDTKRFSEIQKALPDTKQKVLTETLRKLERSGEAGDQKRASDRGPESENEDEGKQETGEDTDSDGE